MGNKKSTPQKTTKKVAAPPPPLPSKPASLEVLVKKMEEYRTCDLHPVGFEGKEQAAAFSGNIHHIQFAKTCELFRRSNNPQEPGQFWCCEQTEGAIRHDFAILPEWNTLEHTASLAVPKGLFAYEGVAAKQQ